MSSTERLARPGATDAPAAPSVSTLRGRRHGEDHLHLLVRDPRRVFATWELSPATASAAASRATAAGVAIRYQLRVERDGDDGGEPATIAVANIPDALGGEGWYFDIAPRAGRCRAVLGLDRNGAFEALLVSRWMPTPPDGPCDRVAPWPLAPGGDVWAAREWSAPRSVGSASAAPSSAARYLVPPAPPATAPPRPAPPRPAGKGRP